MTYVDGFLVPVPTRKLAAYRAIARKAARIWIDHGALDYVECAGDDLKIPPMASFVDAAGAKKGETVVFAYIVYRSRAHRDKVNRAVMADHRVSGMANQSMPFDCTRMAYGGFRTIVRGRAAKKKAR
jgi:uncharacterized protein YbaA (DUF1428 family)